MNLPEIDLMEPRLVAESTIDLLRQERRIQASQRVRSISARDALIALQFEAHLTAVAASNLAYGLSLSDEDRSRLLVAASRIAVIAEEAVR